MTPSLYLTFCAVCTNTRLECACAVAPFAAGIECQQRADGDQDQRYFPAHGYSVNLFYKRLTHREKIRNSGKYLFLTPANLSGGHLPPAYRRSPCAPCIGRMVGERKMPSRYFRRLGLDHNTIAHFRKNCGLSISQGMRMLCRASSRDGTRNRLK